MGHMPGFTELGVFGGHKEARQYNERGLAEYVRGLFPDERGLQQSYLSFFRGSSVGVISTSRAFYSGLGGFFKQNGMILDIGCGKGNFVLEANSVFKRWGINIFGINNNITELRARGAINDSHIRLADWNNLPFEDHFFDAITCFESFPTHAISQGATIGDMSITMKEITRVAKPGTIWRGTMPAYIPNDRSHPVFEVFLSNGWELYICGRVFIARLMVCN